MRTLNNWLTEYSHDHQNLKNKRLHTVCVPAIFLTVVGALHLIPYYIGDALIVLALIWYATLGVLPLAIMTAQLAITLVVTEILAVTIGLAGTLTTLIVVFVIAWFGQFYGHHLEGRRPSFFKDLQYLLIGPLWVWLGH